MAATVVDATRKDHPAGVQGLLGFYHEVTIPTTSLDETDDATLLIKFDDHSFLKVDDFEIDLADLDSGGAPALVWDLGIGDSDGVIDTNLINNSTVGQAAGQDLIDTLTGKASYYVDVSGKYLIFKIVTAAATAAAGAVAIYGTIACGLQKSVST